MQIDSIFELDILIDTPIINIAIKKKLAYYNFECIIFSTILLKYISNCKMWHMNGAKQTIVDTKKRRTKITVDRLALKI